MFGRIEKHPKGYLILFAVILLIIVPCIIAWLINNIPFNLTSHTDNSDWLAFWATFGGNVIGLFGLAIVTIYQDKKQLNQLEMQRSIDNNRMKVELKINLLNRNIDNIRNSVHQIITNLNSIKANKEENIIPFNLHKQNYFDLDSIVKEINYIYSERSNIINLSNDETIFNSNIDKLEGRIMALITSTELSIKDVNVESYVNYLKQLDVNHELHYIHELEEKLNEFNTEKVNDSIIFEYLEKDVQLYRFVMVIEYDMYNEVILDLLNDL